MTSVDTLKEQLTSTLEATHVDMIDTSGNCGSAFEVTVVSPRFRGLPPLKRHQLVHAVFAGEWADQLHALTLKTLTPEQWEKKLASLEPQADPEA